MPEKLGAPDHFKVRKPSGTSVIQLTSLLLSFVNFFLIILLWNSVSPETRSPDTLSLSVTIMGVVLGTLTIILGLGAFGGFWIVRRDAVLAAEDEARREARKVARKVASNQLMKLDRERQSEETGLAEYAGDHSVADDGIANAEPVNEGE